MHNWIIKWGLPIVAFLLPWQTRWIFSSTLLGGEPFDWGVLSFYAVETLLVLTVIFSGLSKLKLSSLPALRSGGVVLIIALISVASAINEPLALVSVVHFGLAGLFFYALLSERVSIERVLWGFCLGLVLPVLLSIFQVTTGGSGASTLLGLAERDAQRLGEAVFELSDGARIERAYGSFGHPNIFGGYLAVGVIGCLYLWRQAANRRIKILLLIVQCFLLTGLVLTFSRSAILGLAIGLSVLSLSIWSQKKITRASLRRALVPLAVLLVVVGLAWPLIVSRLSFSTALESRSVSERVEQFKDWPYVMSDHYLLGRGLGNYTLAVHETFNDRQWWQYQPVHNVVLLITGEIGIFGLIFVLIFWAALLKESFYHWPKWGAVTGLSMISTLFTIAIFDHYLWSLWSGLALTALVGALILRIGPQDK